MGVAKLSVSIDERLATAVREHAGERGLSGFTARALRHELERERLKAFLVDLEKDIGPPDDDLVAEIDALWPDS